MSAGGLSKGRLGRMGDVTTHRKGGWVKLP